MDFLLALLAGATGGSVVVFLLKTWIEARVKSSIQHEYDEKLELFRHELDQRKRTELVSELLSEWIKFPRGEPVPREQRTLLNRLSFQASLWLPSSLAVELSKTIQGQPGAKTIFEIVLLARKVLTGDQSLIPEHVTFWGAQIETKGTPVLYEKP